MSTEDFLVLVDGRYDNKTSSKVVTQLDLTSLAKTLAPTPQDPDTEFRKEDVSRPSIGKRTVGPHRYTIYVPHDDKARLSIGEAHPEEGETGVTIDTKSHIHFQTFGETPTYMSIGNSPVWTGTEVNQHTDGYSLYTHGFSKHFGRRQLSFVSQKEGVSILGNNDVSLESVKNHVRLNSGQHTIVAAKGDVNINAGEEHPFEYGWDAIGGVVMVALDGMSFLAPVHKGTKTAKKYTEVGKKHFDVGHKIHGFMDSKYKEFGKKTYEHWVTQYGATVDKYLGHANTITGLIMGFRTDQRTPYLGKSGWNPGEKKKWYETAKTWAERVGTILGVASDLKKTWFPEQAKVEEKAKKTTPESLEDCECDEDVPEMNGDVKINAKGSTSISADKSVCIYGANGATLSGFKTAKVSGSLGVTISAFKSTEVWGGLGVKVGALAGDVVLNSDFKGCTIKAKEKVDIVSEAAEIVCTGEKNVQLNSNAGEVFVHGIKGMYVGAGKGAGMGVHIVPSNDLMRVGCMKNADDFKGVDSDTTKAVTTYKPGTMLHQVDSTKITVQKSNIAMKSGKMDVTMDGKVSVKGSVIHLC